MIWIIYIMLGVMLLAILFAILVFAQQKRSHEGLGTQSYDVFSVFGSQLTILAGIPVTYDIDEIEQITFSVMRAKSATVYNGILRVVKKNGKKSRPFMFNSSALAKKSVLQSSKQEIEATTQYLMDELRQHHIRCSRTM